MLAQVMDVVPVAPKIAPSFWILSRAGGILAYVLLTSTVVVGVTNKSRIVARFKPAVMIDLHRFLSLLTMGAVSVHLGMLLLDRNKPTTPFALIVPGLMTYRPLWTSFGVISLELMVLIHLSFRYRQKIGMSRWRRLHWATYLVYLGVTTHGLMSGSDSGQAWALGMYATSASLIVGLTAMRALGARPTPVRRPSPTS
jgi:methionine sulfoxide reductase heme-binding subunit